MSPPTLGDAPPGKAEASVAQSSSLAYPVPGPEGDIEKRSAHTPELPKASNVGLSTFKSLSFLDRFLALWIFLAMLVGILLGNFCPSVAPALQRGTFVSVSVPIAVGLLVMMYPILCKVQYERLHEVFRSRGVWIQLGFSLVVNWIVAPFIMVCPHLSPSSRSYVRRRPADD
jgi:ACR3 family arsenite transporter